jgi:hypothetical protein
MGWSKPPSLYQAESTTQIVDLRAESLLNNISPGTSKTEIFVWEWSNDSFTQFLLLFPETMGIDVEID